MKYDWGSRAHAHASIDLHFFFDFRRRKNVGRGCFSFSFFLLFIFFFSLRDPRDFSFFLFFFSLFLFLFAGRYGQTQKCAELHSPAHLPKSKIICFIQVLIVSPLQKPQFYSTITSFPYTNAV